MGGCKQLICFIIFNFSFIFKCKTNARICRLKVKTIYVNFHLNRKEVRGLLLEESLGEVIFLKMMMQAMSV